MRIKLSYYEQVFFFTYFNLHFVTFSTFFLFFFFTSFRHRSRARHSGGGASTLFSFTFRSRWSASRTIWWQIVPARVVLSLLFLGFYRRSRSVSAFQTSFVLFRSTDVFSKPPVMVCGSFVNTVRSLRGSVYEPRSTYISLLYLNSIQYSVNV